MPRASLRALACLLCAGTLYGLLFSVNKIATTSEVPTLAYVFWHTLGGALLILVVCAAARRLPGMSRAHIKLYLVGGAAGIAIPVSLLAHVAPHLPASLVVMVVCLSPPCTYLMAMAFRMERLHLPMVAGVALGLAGVAVLVIPGMAVPTIEEARWLMLALLAPVCFATFNVSAARLWPANAHPLALACGLQFGGAAVLLPVMLGTGQLYFFPGPLLEGDLAILWATLLTAAEWYFVFETLRLAGPVFLSQIGYIVVLTGIGWGAAIFGERPGGMVWVAAALLFAGLALMTLGKRRGSTGRG